MSTVKPTTGMGTLSSAEMAVVNRYIQEIESQLDARVITDNTNKRFYMFVKNNSPRMSSADGDTPENAKAKREEVLCRFKLDTKFVSVDRFSSSGYDFNKELMMQTINADTGFNLLVEDGDHFFVNEKQLISNMAVLDKDRGTNSGFFAKYTLVTADTNLNLTYQNGFMQSVDQQEFFKAAEEYLTEIGEDVDEIMQNPDPEEITIPQRTKQEFMHLGISYFYRYTFSNALKRRLYHFGAKDYINVENIYQDYLTKGYIPYLEGDAGTHWTDYDERRFRTTYPKEKIDKYAFGVNNYIERLRLAYNRFKKTFNVNGSTDLVTLTDVFGQPIEMPSTVEYGGAMYLPVYLKDLWLTEEDAHAMWMCAYFDCSDYLPKWGTPLLNVYTADVPEYNEDGEETGNTVQKECVEFYFCEFYEEERRKEMSYVIKRTFKDLAKKVNEECDLGLPLDPWTWTGNFVGTYYHNTYDRWDRDKKIQIAKSIHDYIIEHNEYDLDSEYGQSLYGAMGGWEEEGKGPVCTSYALAFKYCCNRFGIVCMLSPGWAGEHHMWNRITYEDAFVVNEGKEDIRVYWTNEQDRIRNFIEKEDNEHMNRYHKEEDGTFAYHTGRSLRQQGMNYNMPWVRSATQFERDTWYDVDVCWDDGSGSDMYFNVSSKFMIQNDGRKYYSRFGTDSGLECYTNHLGQDYLGDQNLSGAGEEEVYTGGYI